MRILFVTTSFPRFLDDYAGSFVYRFAKYLVRAGSAIDVVAPSAPDVDDYDELEGIRISRFRYFLKQKQCLCYVNGGILANLRTSWLARIQLPLFVCALLLFSLRRVRRYDIVHCHWLPVAMLMILARVLTRSKCRIILTNWGSDTRLFPLWLQRFVITCIDGCVSTAEETDRHLRAAGSTDFATIPVPVDEDKFSRITDLESYRKQLQIANGVPVISFIGRLNYFKDPLTFIRACDALKSKGMGFTALMAGGGDLENECVKLIAHLGLQREVRLLGFREDTESILALSAVTVHISPIENTWANVIAEAMFVGVPVILTDVGFTRETFSDGIDCLMVPAESPLAIADAVIKVLHDRDLSHQLATQAGELMKRHGKIGDVAAQRLINYYQKVLA